MLFVQLTLSACGSKSDAEAPTPPTGTAPVAATASECHRIAGCCAAADAMHLYGRREREECATLSAGTDEPACAAFLGRMQAAQTTPGPLAGSIPVACLAPGTPAMDPATAAALRAPRTVGHCNGRADTPGICQEFTSDSAATQNLCVQSMGTWGSGACPRDNAVGSCDRVERVEIYYSPRMTAEAATAACGRGSLTGTFAALP